MSVDRHPESVVPHATRRWLSSTQGLVEYDEGMMLAELAALVPAERGIVEIGSHTGLSTCWLAAGSRAGAGAHVVAVDPYPAPRPDSLDDPWELGPEGVLARFQSNIAGTTQDSVREDFGSSVTLLRATSELAAGIWTKAVGLLFIDAIHEEWAVRQDYRLWEPFIPTGGYLACHDYGESYPGCKAAIDWIAATGQWEHFGLVGSLWTATRR